MIQVQVVNKRTPVFQYTYSYRQALHLETVSNSPLFTRYKYFSYSFINGYMRQI